MTFMIFQMAAWSMGVRVWGLTVFFSPTNPHTLHPNKGHRTTSKCYYLKTTVRLPYGKLPARRHLLRSFQ